jgi:hypothetical protein
MNGAGERDVAVTARAAVAALVGLALATGAARADKIDGSWCDSTGQRLSIDGPAIVTPGGHAITGDYNRHHFSYVVPADEPNGGATMQLRLLNEETMQRRAGPGTTVETWHRCATPVS